jgi:hypothetical protein
MLNVVEGYLGGIVEVDGARAFGNQDTYGVHNHTERQVPLQESAIWRPIDCAGRGELESRSGKAKLQAKVAARRPTSEAASHGAPGNPNGPFS